jgi:hypothetical protein
MPCELKHSASESDLQELSAKAPKIIIDLVEEEETSNQDDTTTTIVADSVEVVSETIENENSEDSDMSDNGLQEEESEVDDTPCDSGSEDNDEVTETDTVIVQPPSSECTETNDTRDSEALEEGEVCEQEAPQSVQTGEDIYYRAKILDAVLLVEPVSEEDRVITETSGDGTSTETTPTVSQLEQGASTEGHVIC